MAATLIRNIGKARLNGYGADLFENKMAVLQLDLIETHTLYQIKQISLLIVSS